MKKVHAIDTQEKNAVELLPIFSNVKSFYNKAKIIRTHDDGEPITYILKSYKSHVAKVEVVSNKQIKFFSDYWQYSQTTQRHIIEFIKQYFLRYTGRDTIELYQQLHNYITHHNKLFTNGVIYLEMDIQDKIISLDDDQTRSSDLVYFINI